MSQLAEDWEGDMASSEEARNKHLTIQDFLQGEATREYGQDGSGLGESKDTIGIWSKIKGR